MDEEYKKKLDKLIIQSEENNFLLKKVRRSQKNSSIYKVVYWILVFVIGAGGYLVAQPYVANVLNLYNGGISALKGIEGIQGATTTVKK